MNSENIIGTVSPYTMTNPVRMQALYDTVVDTAWLEGDVVETGCRDGGSSMLMAMTLKMCEVNDKMIYMYDTFEGMPKPTEYDYKESWKLDPNRKNKLHKRDIVKDWLKADIESVKKNITKAHYPIDNFILVKGLVEETIPDTMPDKISLLRLDTDFYTSTLHALIHLYPRLVKGGHLVIDDYGCWAGCKKAVDEYFKDQGLDTRALITIDLSCREYIK